VKVHRAYRYRLYPTPEQASRLLAWEDALRFLWNLALEQWRMGLARPRDERVYPTSFGQERELGRGARGARGRVPARSRATTTRRRSLVLRRRDD